MNTYELANDLFRDHLQQCPFNNALDMYQLHGERPYMEERFGYDCGGQSAIVRDRLRSIGIEADVFRTQNGGPMRHCVAAAQIYGDTMVFESS